MFAKTTVSFFTLSLIVAAFICGPASAQASLKPDTTPRLPPQAGQGLPMEDQAFMVRAVNLSEAEIEVARLAVEKAPSGPLRSLAEQLAAEHQTLREAVTQLAQKHKVTMTPHAARADWQQDLQRFRALGGEAFARDFLAWQLGIHLSLADLYQTQASNTPATDLAKFAIVTLKQVQDRFEQVKQLAAPYGLTAATIKQPPQY
jgi:predicted outer membrane protein